MKEINSPMELAQEAQARKSTFFWLGVCACVVLAILLRSLPIGTRSFDIDEVYELVHLSTNVLDIAKDPDGFPPTFRWLLSLYIFVSGEEYSRTLCVLLGAATVIVCAILGRKIGGDLVGFNSGLIFAVSASQVAFGQLLRAYALYTFAIALTMLSGWMLAQNTSRRNWLFFLASSFFAMGVHYYSVYFLAVVWIYVLFCYPRNEYPSYFGYAALFTILCSPWFLCLGIDLSEPLPPEWINKFDLKSLAYLYLSLIQGKFTGPSQTELWELPWKQGMIALAPWAIAGFTFASVLVIQGVRVFGLRQTAWLIAMLVVLPVLAGTVAMLIHSTFGARYLAPLSLPFALVVGCGMFWRGKPVPVVATYGLIALNLLSVTNRSFDPRYDRENYRALVAKMQESQEVPAVIVLSHYVAPAIRRELPEQSTFCSIGLGGNEPDDWQLNLETFSKTLGHHKKVFLVATSTQGSDINRRQRDRLVELVDAELIARISNSTDLFILESEKLRKTVLDVQLKRDP